MIAMVEEGEEGRIGRIQGSYAFYQLSGRLW